MNQLTSRELLYLEDLSKMFEQMSKTCDFAETNSTDPQFKSFLQSMAQEHRQWIQTTASIVNKNGLQ